MKLPQRSLDYFQKLNAIAIESSAISVIESTIDYRNQLFELIRSAKKRIYITALYLQDDDAGKEVLQAIYQAKQDNPELDVKIFVDFLRAQRGLMGFPESIGNIRLYREYAERYEHQIDILGVPVKSKEVLGVLHLKGFIFDDKVLYSGASINNVYLQQQTRYRYDRYQLIQSRRLADSMVRFLRNYMLQAAAVKSLTGKSIVDKKQLKPSIRQFKKALRFGNYVFEPDNSPINETQVKVTPLLGFGGRKNPLNQTIYELVKNTRQRIIIYTPYFNLPNKINKAVRRLLKNGKVVDIVVGDKKANDFYIPEEQDFNKVGVVPYVYETNLRKFTKRNQKFIDSGLLNINLWYHDNNSFHLKGICVDQTQHLITGHNINPRAWLLDLENGILIQDEKQLLSEDFQREHQKILTHTKRLEHFEQIETISDYPEAAQKLMRTVKRAKLDSILNRLL